MVRKELYLSFVIFFALLACTTLFWRSDKDVYLSFRSEPLVTIGDFTPRVGIFPPIATSSPAVVETPVRRSLVGGSKKVTEENVQPIIPPIAQNLIYEKGLAAVVNILCEDPAGTFTIATGSIIDPRGYILANAHVADNLGDKKTCSIRRGSPAQIIGNAELVFLPQAYVTATSTENRARSDISIWKITLPNQSLSWNLATRPSVKQNDTLLTLSYPAELLGSELILKSLNLVFSNTTVDAVDSFFIRSHSGFIAQHGSSGGILVNPYTGTIEGMIFGINNEETITKRELFSLTAHAIDVVVKKETGKSFIEYLAGNP